MSAIGSQLFFRHLAVLPTFLFFYLTEIQLLVQSHHHQKSSQQLLSAQKEGFDKLLVLKMARS